MGQFLTGDAKTWFMTNIAPNPNEWTVEWIGRELFDTFFPPRIRSQF
jgi:hypothetical protein